MEQVERNERHLWGISWHELSRHLYVGFTKLDIYLYIYMYWSITVVYWCFLFSISQMYFLRGSKSNELKKKNTGALRANKKKCTSGGILRGEKIVYIYNIHIYLCTYRVVKDVKIKSFTLGGRIESSKCCFELAFHREGFTRKRC